MRLATEFWFLSNMCNHLQRTDGLNLGLPLATSIFYVCEQRMPWQVVNVISTELCFSLIPMLNVVGMYICTFVHDCQEKQNYFIPYDASRCTIGEAE